MSYESFFSFCLPSGAFRIVGTLLFFSFLFVAGGGEVLRLAFAPSLPLFMFVVL